MNITIDDAEIMRAIGDMERAYDALNKTVDDKGHARVMTSRRKMTTSERKRRTEMRRRFKRTGNPKDKPGPLIGGHIIANFLRAKGHDPFNYPDKDWREINAMQQELIGDALQDAYRTNRPQHARIKQILNAGARALQESSKKQIYSGPRTGTLGRNSRKYMWFKIRNYDRGNITTKYGRPPPYGILSGRFYEGIRTAWFAGKGRR